MQSCAIIMMRIAAKNEVATREGLSRRCGVVMTDADRQKRCCATIYVLCCLTGSADPAPAAHKIATQRSVQCIYFALIEFHPNGV